MILKKIGLLLILAILFNCQAGTTNDLTQCDFELHLTPREYVDLGSLSVTLSKISERGFEEESYPLPLDGTGKALLPLAIGDFNIVSVMFQSDGDSITWQSKKDFFLKDKDKVLISCKVWDNSLEIDLDGQETGDTKAYSSFFAQLNEIIAAPGAHKRRGKEAEKFAVRFMDFTNDFIDKNSTIDENLKKYLKIQGYSQALFRDMDLMDADIFEGGFFDLYDSGLTLFNVLPQVILKQALDKNLSLVKTGHIDELEQEIEYLKDRISNPSVKAVLMKRYLQNFKSSYVFNNETFQQDLGKYKILVNHLSDADEREELIRSFEKNSHTGLGANFPNIEFMTMEGEQLKSEAIFDGKNYVYIDIWASWCLPCIKEIPALKELEKVYTNDKVKFVSISIDSKTESWYRALKTHELHGYQYLDVENNLGEILNIQGIPRFLLYDPNGKLISIDAPRPSSKEVRNILEKYL